MTSNATLISSFLDMFLPRLDDILNNPDEAMITVAIENGVSKKSLLFWVAD